MQYLEDLSPLPKLLTSHDWIDLPIVQKRTRSESKIYSTLMLPYSPVSITRGHICILDRGQSYQSFFQVAGITPFFGDYEGNHYVIHPRPSHKQVSGHRLFSETLEYDDDMATLAEYQKHWRLNGDIDIYQILLEHRQRRSRTSSYYFNKFALLLADGLDGWRQELLYVKQTHTQQRSEKM